MFTEAVKPEPTARSDRSMTTREAILAAAEWLFAERGMYAVSNRQISEAAGQGNNAAACYHFGTRTELLRAIESKHRAVTIRDRAIEPAYGRQEAVLRKNGLERLKRTFHGKRSLHGRGNLTS